MLIFERFDIRVLNRKYRKLLKSRVLGIIFRYRYFCYEYSTDTNTVLHRIYIDIIVRVSKIRNKVRSIRNKDQRKLYIMGYLTFSVEINYKYWNLLFDTLTTIFIFPTSDRFLQTIEFLKLNCLINETMVISHKYKHATKGRRVSRYLAIVNKFKKKLIFKNQTVTVLGPLVSSLPIRILIFYPIIIISMSKSLCTVLSSIRFGQTSFTFELLL